MHLLANLLATALVAAYGWAARVPVEVALAWLVAWPFTHVALWAKPELLHYGGLSGVLHAGVAAVTVWLVLRGQGAHRTIGWMMLVGQASSCWSKSPGAPRCTLPPNWTWRWRRWAMPAARWPARCARCWRCTGRDSARRQPRHRLAVPDNAGDFMITLCGFGVSNYYNKVKMVLLEKGIDFTEERVMTKSTDEAVLSCTPLGKIPFIRTEHGALCESQVDH